MVNLLYIGNKISHQHSNITTIDTLGNLLINEGYDVTFSSSKITKLFRLIDMLFSVLIHSRKTDYVLIDTYSTLNFYYAFLVSQLCRLLKLKYIPILHGGNLPKRLDHSPRKSKMLFDNAYCCVSPSLFLKEIFENKAYSNIMYIPNTIEIVNYKFYQRPIDKVKLLWVRSFKEIYNPLLAIRVAKKLKDEGIDTELCMIGPDGDGTFLYATSLARDLNVDVKFTGKLPKQEWISLSRGYNIFINTSFFDNMPVSLIEAMALGLPLVTTNVGGIPYLIQDDTEGILVNQDSVDEMTAAIKQLIQNPKKVELITKNARRKAELFDWSVVKKKWQDILK